MMASLNNQTVLQTQILIKTIDSTPLISFENRLFVQLSNDNNNSYGSTGAANRFDLGREDRALIPESVSAC